MYALGERNLYSFSESLGQKTTRTDREIQTIKAIING